MSTNVKVKSGFVLSGLVLAELNKVDRQGKTPLYFVKIACPATYKAYQAMAFLDAPEIVATHVGKKVTVELDPGTYQGRDTFTVTNIIPE
jgi:hypothetical protein